MSKIHNQMIVTIFDDGTTYLFGHSDRVDKTELALINGIRELMDKLYPESPIAGQMCKCSHAYHEDYCPVRHPGGAPCFCFEFKPATGGPHEK